MEKRKDKMSWENLNKGCMWIIGSVVFGVVAIGFIKVIFGD